MPYPPELKERAVRMVLEWRRERDRTDGGFEEVAQKLGVHPESIRNWLKTQQVDAGERPGLTTDERKRIAELERENRELQRPTLSAENQGRTNTCSQSAILVAKPITKESQWLMKTAMRQHGMRFSIASSTSPPASLPPRVSWLSLKRSRGLQCQDSLTVRKLAPSNNSLSHQAAGFSRTVVVEPCAPDSDGALPERCNPHLSIAVPREE